jgi:hypothetical protein
MVSAEQSGIPTDCCGTHVHARNGGVIPLAGLDCLSRSDLCRVA